MIWFFAPYSFEGKLFEAYDRYMSLIKNPEDWIVVMDGDTLFFQSNFGHMIEDYINHYPDTGMFVCFANRIGCKEQLYSDDLSEVDSIRKQYLVAEFLHKNHHCEVTELQSPTSGFMMAIQQKTWGKIRDKLEEKTKDNFLLRVDRLLASVLLEKKMPIRRMDGVFMLHYYRMVEGSKEKRGLK